MGDSSRKFRVQIVASRASPSWLNGVAVGEWKEIPGSEFSIGVNDQYLEKLGLTPPSQRPAPHTNRTDWGTNKYGHPAWRYEDTTWTARYFGFHGMAVDQRNSRIYVGSGDAIFPDNSYHYLDLELDTPAWTVSAITGSHKDYYKHPARGGRTYPAPVPGDFAEIDLYYDGRHRAGHTYWNQQIIGARDWLVHFTSNQFYPTDEGSSPTPHIADLASGQWVITRPPLLIEPLKNSNGSPIIEGDRRYWKEKHKTTEDVYMFRGDILWRWVRASNTYEQVYDFEPLYGQWDMYDVGGAINHEEGYILCEGGVGSGHATRAIFVLDLTKSEGANLTSKTDITEFTGPARDQISLGRDGSMQWCSDLKKFLAYKDTIDVFSIERRGPTTFYCETMPRKGDLPGDQIIRGGLGGMYTKWQYIPRLHGFVAHWKLNQAMRFFRTG